MSQDLPVPRQEKRIPVRDDDTTVVEWGDAEPESPGRAGRSLAALGRDRRLPTVLAGLATVAAVASLIGEWLIITVPAEARDDDAPTRLTSGISEIGGFGVAYLVGLLGLSVALALALRGAPAVRRHAALAGLGIIQAPRLGVRQALHEGTLVELLPHLPAEPMPVTLLYAQRRHLPTRMRVFMDWLAALFEQAVRAH